MAASKSTVERVLEVILKHVPKETALKILEELMTVPGVPRYHRADVQPCASTLIATIPGMTSRLSRDQSQAPPFGFKVSAGRSSVANTTPASAGRSLQ